MLRHGLLLRCGIRAINHQTLTSVIQPRYTRSSLGYQELILKKQNGFPSRNNSNIAAVPEPNLTPVAQDEKPVDIGLPAEHNETKIVKQPPDIPVSISDTLRQMIIDKSNEDDEDIEDNPQRIKKWTNDQEKILFQAIEKGVALTNSEWEDLRVKILAAGTAITSHNIDASVIGICVTYKHLATGRSYFDYLSASGNEPNVASIAKFFKLCFLCSSEINEDIEKQISSVYDSLHARHPSLDAGTAESVIHGLSITKRWKEGLELLGEIRLTCTPNTSTYSALIKAAFDNDEADIGWELLSKMIDDNRKPLIFAYEAWLKYSHRFAAGDANVEQKLVDKLLYFFANNDIRLSEDAVKMIRLWFEYETPFEANWDPQYTTVDSRGMCRTCHQYLRPVALRQEEFEALRSAFMEKAVVGSNVFLKSSPEELAEYQEFVKKTAPYDIVIDGLNVGYSAGAAGRGNPRTYGKMLQSVVQHFVRRDRKVLVLGRRHMTNWPAEHMDYIYENAEVFLAQNISQDDPFLIYAAMYSGLGTDFISRDMMRGHAYLLKDPKLQSYFRRWQKQHQHQVQYVGEGGNVRLREPIKFNTSTQRGRNGTWHIPYDVDSAKQRSQVLSPPFQWLCLNKYYEHRSNESSQDGDSDSFRPRQKKYDRDSFVNEPNQSFRSKGISDRKSFDDFSTLDEDDGGNTKSFRPREKQYNREPFKKRFSNSLDDLGLSDDDVKSTGEFKPKRAPRKKWNDEDSDDEPVRDRRQERRTPVRKSKDDWDN